MKRKYYIITTIIFILGLFAYIKYNYFFNPFTFKQGSFTYLPFNWYKNPMTYSYVGFGKYEGLKGKEVSDSEEINFIYKELQKSTTLDSLRDQNIKENWIGFFIRSESNGIVLNLSWYSETNICRVKSFKQGDRTTPVFIKITPELQKFFKSKIT